MTDVLVLTLGSGGSTPCGGHCGGTEGATCDAASGCDAHSGPAVRVPVLHLRDALTAGGARVRTRTAESDVEIDDALALLDGRSRDDDLLWPATGDVDAPRLVIAASTDGEVRAVLRRMVRRYAPPPSRRPADLRADRTVPDLPPVAILTLDAGTTGTLVDELRLPRSPGEVARAVLDGRTRRLDLLRNDAGSVTLHGTLIGGTGDDGRATPWRGRVEVDDAILSDGDDALLACVIANAGGYSTIDGLPLTVGADPADGWVEVAVAVPVTARSAWGAARVRVEVRRARGRAVAVSPREEVPLLDDGVAGSLGRKRSWWLEPDAWAVYVA